MPIIGYRTLARDMLMARYGSLAAYLQEVEAKAALRKGAQLPPSLADSALALAYLAALQSVFENYHWLLGELGTGPGTGTTS